MTKDQFWGKKNKAIRLASKLATLLDELGLDRSAVAVGGIQNKLMQLKYGNQN